jgi:hypothetical protein
MSRPERTPAPGPTRIGSPFSRVSILEKNMRKIAAIICATGALTFGGAGVANATTIESPAPATSTITLAQDDIAHDSDKTGLWGLAGLLGLLGLVGLKRRNDRVAPGAVATPGYGGATPPRV